MKDIAFKVQPEKYVFFILLSIFTLVIVNIPFVKTHLLLDMFEQDKIVPFVSNIINISLHSYDTIVRISFLCGIAFVNILLYRQFGDKSFWSCLILTSAIMTYYLSSAFASLYNSGDIMMNVYLGDIISFFILWCALIGFTQKVSYGSLMGSCGLLLICIFFSPSIGLSGVLLFVILAYWLSFSHSYHTSYYVSAATVKICFGILGMAMSIFLMGYDIKLLMTPSFYMKGAWVSLSFFIYYIIRRILIKIQVQENIAFALSAFILFVNMIFLGHFIVI